VPKPLLASKAREPTNQPTNQSTNQPTNQPNPTQQIFSMDGFGVKKKYNLHI
jgi:hypothetical protein